MNTIPPGYKMTFVSYEGDADNQKTIVKEGLQEKEAMLLKELADALEVNYIPCPIEPLEYKKLHKVFYNIVKNYEEEVGQDQLNLMMGDFGIIQDYIHDNILGYPANDYTARVLNYFTIDYVPHKIVLEDGRKKLEQISEIAKKNKKT